jgi:hypothetical protein
VERELTVGEGLEGDLVALEAGASVLPRSSRICGHPPRKVSNVSQASGTRVDVPVDPDEEEEVFRLESHCHEVNG